MDEGLPIAYAVLAEGVPVYCSDGETVGTVEHVVAAPALDIFHGINVSTGAGRRFIAADAIATLHERGVDLRSIPQQPRTFPSLKAARRRCTSASPASR